MWYNKKCLINSSSLIYHVVCSGTRISGNCNDAFSLSEMMAEKAYFANVTTWIS